MKNENNKLPILFEDTPQGDFLFKLFLSSILWVFFCMSINLLYEGFSWGIVLHYLLILIFLPIMCVIFGVVISLFIAIFFNNIQIDNLEKISILLKEKIIILLYVIIINTGSFIELLSCFANKKIFFEDLFNATIIFGSCGLLIFIIFHAIISPILNFILKSK